MDKGPGQIPIWDTMPISKSSYIDNNLYFTRAQSMDLPEPNKIFMEKERKRPISTFISKGLEK